MPIDAVIVGGGVAGAATAAYLAKAGCKVVVVEREPEAHHKVCGEFLSHEAVRYLEQLGVKLHDLGAHGIHRVSLARQNRVTGANLPFPALSLSRKALDAALLDHAADCGADIRRGVAVQMLEQSDTGWRARLRGGEVLEAGAAFLASGKHDLRGWPRSGGVQSDLIGFKQYWRLSSGQAAKLSGGVELMLFDGGYAGLQTVEDGLVNLCLLVKRSQFAALGQSWDALLEFMRVSNALLRERLAGAVPVLGRPLAIFAIPYGYLASESGGLWCVGDQAAVIPSFSGDGMSIALHSARMASRFFLAGAQPQAYLKAMTRDVGWQVAFATRLSQVAVNSVGCRVIAGAIDLFPQLMTGAAIGTRVPTAALRRVGMSAQ